MKRCKANHEVYCDNGVEGIEGGESERDWRQYKAHELASQVSSQSGRGRIPNPVSMGSGPAVVPPYDHLAETCKKRYPAKKR